MWSCLQHRLERKPTEKNNKTRARKTTRTCRRTRRIARTTRMDRRISTSITNLPTYRNHKYIFG
jgi:hypothetical protein